MQKELNSATDSAYPQSGGNTNCCDRQKPFATQNAPRLSADTLQALMRHKSYQTTQCYINMAGQLEDAVASLHVPEFDITTQPTMSRFQAVDVEPV